MIPFQLGVFFDGNEFDGDGTAGVALDQHSLGFQIGYAQQTC